MAAELFQPEPVAPSHNIAADTEAETTDPVTIAESALNCTSENVENNNNYNQPTTIAAKVEDVMMDLDDDPPQVLNSNGEIDCLAVEKEAREETMEMKEIPETVAETNNSEKEKEVDLILIDDDDDKDEPVHSQDLMEADDPQPTNNSEINTATSAENEKTAPTSVTASVLQIHWHDRKAIFCIDFCKGIRTVDNHKVFRFATSGADNLIRMWDMFNDSASGKVLVKYVATLERHLRPVNAIKFHPVYDTILASAGDDGFIHVWRRQSIVCGGEKSIGDEYDSMERWIPFVSINNSFSQFNDGSGLISPEVNDLSWIGGVGCSKASYLATVGSDHVLNVFHIPLILGEEDSTGDSANVSTSSNSIAKATRLLCIRDHGHFVQGVSSFVFPSPLLAGSPSSSPSMWLATQSADSSIRIYQLGSVSASTKKSHSNSVVIGAPLPGEKKICLGAKCVRQMSRIPIIKPIDSQPVVSEQNKENDIICDNNINGSVGTEKKPVQRQQYFKLFEDETLSSFYRRLTFSPDGSFIFYPAGWYSRSEKGNGSGSSSNLSSLSSSTPSSKREHCVYISITRKSVIDSASTSAPQPNTSSSTSLPLSSTSSSSTSPSPNVISGKASNFILTPDACLPGLKSSCVAIKFQPHHLYALTPDPTIERWNDLPYKMVYALITLDRVYIHDTESMLPLVIVKNLHLSHLIDASWSPDGLALLVTSNDGYCSMIKFPEGYFGATYSQSGNESQQELDSSNLVHSPASSMSLSSSSIPPPLFDQVSSASLIDDKLAASASTAAALDASKRPNPAFSSAPTTPTGRRKSKKSAELAGTTGSPSLSANRKKIKKMAVDNETASQLVQKEISCKDGDGDVVVLMPKEKKRITPIFVKSITPNQ